MCHHRIPAERDALSEYETVLEARDDESADEEPDQPLDEPEPDPEAVPTPSD